MNAVAFAPKGRLLALASEHGGLRIIDLVSGKEVRRLAEGAIRFEMMFSPDGKMLAAISEAGVIHLWDPETGRLLPGSADLIVDDVDDLAFSSDGKRISGSARVRTVWDSVTGHEIRRYFRIDSELGTQTISPDEKLLVSVARDCTIGLHEAASGKKVRSLTGHNPSKHVLRVVFSGIAAS